MVVMIIVLNILLSVIYGITAILYGAYFIKKRSVIAKISSYFLLAGIIFHPLFLISIGLNYNRFPIANSFESLSVLAFDIAIIYYITERVKKEYTTGVFFLTIVFLCQLISTWLFKGEGSTNALLSNPMFGFHATFTLLGFSALAISSLYALMYCMLAKQIKKRHFGVIYQGLPSLETLDSMRQYATVCGIILLGMGILLGHFWAYKILGNFQLTDPKVLITDIAWILFSLIYWFNWKNGVHGLRTNILSVWLFIVLFLVVAVLEFFLNTFHRFE